MNQKAPLAEPLPRIKSMLPRIKSKRPKTRKGLMFYLEKLRRQGQLNPGDIPLLRELRKEYGR